MSQRKDKSARVASLQPSCQVSRAGMVVVWRYFRQSKRCKRRGGCEGMVAYVFGVTILPNSFVLCFTAQQVTFDLCRSPATPIKLPSPRTSLQYGPIYALQTRYGDHFAGLCAVDLHYYSGATIISLSFFFFLVRLCQVKVELAVDYASCVEGPGLDFDMGFQSKAETPIF